MSQTEQQKAEISINIDLEMTHDGVVYFRDPDGQLQQFNEFKSEEDEARLKLRLFFDLYKERIQAWYAQHGRAEPPVAWDKALRKWTWLNRAARRAN